MWKGNTMAENDYIKCPKCQTIYHVKAEKCPKCNITPEEHAVALAKQKKKTETKEQARAEKELGKTLYCVACGSMFKRPKTMTRGHILIEIILWLAFLIPGLIYTIWRLSTKYKVCPNCKSTTIIPANSPVAKKVLNE